MKVLEFVLKMAYWPSVFMLIINLEKEAQAATSETTRVIARVAYMSILLFAMAKVMSFLAVERMKFHNERNDGLSGKYSFEQREAHLRDAWRYDVYSKLATAFTVWAAVVYYLCMDVLF